MASNSEENPAPILIIDVFNDSLWTNTTKKTSTQNGIPSSDLATLDGTNSFVSLNQFSDVYFNNKIKYSNYYINSVFQVPVSGNYSLPTPLSSIYLVRGSGPTAIIQLPTASVNYAGCTITFIRTLGGRNFVSNSANINNIDTLTYSNLLLAGSWYSSTITCVENASVYPFTYNWFMVYRS